MNFCRRRGEPVEGEGYEGEVEGGFHSHGGTPLSLDGLFHGKRHLEMDDNDN